METYSNSFQTYYTEKLQEQMDFLKRDMHNIDGGDAEAEKLWSKLKEMIPTFFEGIGEVKPSLLHGDLWSGNAGVTSDGVGGKERLADDRFRESQALLRISWPE